ncbi:nuclear transport factor 2 family protein [uncultured Maricaulis sp.]|uniref:nuclear transport factor 2 family protein n=1 Tax=uncultured Maricaulis sp. TaxID=174710 RepID=UPI0030D6F13C|tara:strand:- start:18529 stop:19065 length:537 start_codon:yes stop_codon:yes gene_type:complete
MFRFAMLAAFGLALTSACAAVAQTSPESQTGPESMTEAEINTELTALDHAMFEATFDTCDLDRIRSLITDDVEFYHDRSGLEITDADSFMAQVNCLNWTQGDDPQIRRVLEPGSLTSRRLGNYGAMQTGRHSFYMVHDDGSEQLLETANFIHIWRYSPDGWRIARIISYDHQDVDAAQ